MELAETERFRLHLQELSKALRTLREIFDKPSSDFTRDRDAAIQRFEYTFELSWKIMKLTAEGEGIACPSPQRAIRAAGQLGLVASVEEWLTMLKARNLTVHTYNENIAQAVLNSARRFAVLAEALVTALAAEGK